uniref:Uncharacterized protein n=1 Tax=Chromera velia CCMP2878 TaxID=1169474 RepID=A0A0G4HMB4_9ALVE|eukprot:Cvel_29034.t1-p1 / transcript=Cvel_29034.t1 / gene=Cvel_29034 / organism=Chromera_velia_CCMP2878 / gene_product=hypothetical protein / transcript_product=hypothetical protein / location=Cvel_scaffold3912:7582-9098(-) / protein_length=82 / sequence_SO=supercontig / SO=protein_coding / is_pseudo=false
MNYGVCCGDPPRCQQEGVCLLYDSGALAGEWCVPCGGHLQPTCCGGDPQQPLCTKELKPCSGGATPSGRLCQGSGAIGFTEE